MKNFDRCVLAGCKDHTFVLEKALSMRVRGAHVLVMSEYKKSHNDGKTPVDQWGIDALQVREFLNHFLEN